MTRARPSGWTLVEVGLACCIVGTILCVFVPSFLKRVRTNKIAEAPELLHQMFQGVAAYYATEHRVSTNATPGDHGASPPIGRCVPDAAGPTPSAPYGAPQDVDFTDRTSLGYLTWQALGFQPARPVRYSYQFTTAKAGCEPRPAGPIRVRLIAEGDLDDDGLRSRFELIALGKDELQHDGPLRVLRRTE